MNRNEVVEQTRRHIGKGVRLYYIGGKFFILSAVKYCFFPIYKFVIIRKCRLEVTRETRALLINCRVAIYFIKRKAKQVPRLSASSCAWLSVYSRN